MTHMKSKSGRLKFAGLPRKDALESREVDRNRKPWGRAAAEASNHAKARPETARKRQGIASSTEKPQIPLRGRVESSAKSTAQTLENEKVVTNPRYEHPNVRWQELTDETAFRFATINIDLWINSCEITLNPAVGPKTNAHNADS